MLDVPATHCVQDPSGGVLPIVPAGHAVNPDSAVASILDPSGTTTEEDPPSATIDPALTRVQLIRFGLGCKYPVGQLSHSALPSSFENVPGEQGKHVACPVSV